MMMRMRSRSGRRRHRACEASREAGLASGVSRVAPGSSFPQWDPVPASYEMVEVFGNWLAVNHVQIFFLYFCGVGGVGHVGGGRGMLLLCVGFAPNVIFVICLHLFIYCSFFSCSCTFSVLFHYQLAFMFVFFSQFIPSFASPV